MKSKFRVLFIVAVLSIMCVSVTVKAAYYYNSPTMQNPNIKSIIHYDELRCPTGKEAGSLCTPSSILEINVGDFVEYTVKSNTDLSFRVIKVTDDKLVLMQNDVVIPVFYGNLQTASYNNVVGAVKALDYTYANITSMFNSRARLISQTELADLGCNMSSPTNCPDYTYTDNSGSGRCTHYLVGTKSDGSVIGSSKANNGLVESLTQDANEQLDGLCYKPVIEVNKYVANPYYNQNGSNNIVTYDNVKDAIEEGKITDSSGNTLGLDDVVVSANGQVLTKDGQPVYDKEGKTVFVKNDTVSVGDTLKIAYIGYIIGLLVLVIGAFVIYKSIKDSEVSIEE